MILFFSKFGWISDDGWILDDFHIDDNIAIHSIWFNKFIICCRNCFIFWEMPLYTPFGWCYRILLQDSDACSSINGNFNGCEVSLRDFLAIPFLRHIEWVLISIYNFPLHKLEPILWKPLLLKFSLSLLNLTYLMLVVKFVVW